ncbi:MAG: glycosyltransferase [Planctomycetota bacterium]|nr:glycosyltransferase [Planctomycetota bacterium]
MRTIFITVGSHGDVNPFMAVAGALHRRGHDVELVANPTFADKVASAGLRFCPMGERATMSELFGRHPEMMSAWKGHDTILEKLVLPTMEPIAKLLRERFASERRPDLVVAHGGCFAAKWICDEVRAPFAVLTLSPLNWFTDADSMSDPRFGTLSPDRRLDRAARGTVRWLVRAKTDRQLNPWRARLNLQPTERIVADMFRGGTLNLGLWSPMFRPPRAGDPDTGIICGFAREDRHDHATNPDALEQFLASGPPPVLFTLGTALSHSIRGVSEQAIAACHRLGHRVLVIDAAGPPDERVVRSELGDARPDACHVARAPFSQVFPRCSAVIHHGGIGTMAEALSAGKPQLVMYAAYDQLDNAERARRLGVAESLSVHRVSPEKIQTRLQMILNERVRRHASLVADLLRREKDGAEVAADALESIAAHRS